jgi:hypothetical protein
MEQVNWTIESNAANSHFCSLCKLKDRSIQRNTDKTQIKIEALDK